MSRVRRALTRLALAAITVSPSAADGLYRLAEAYCDGDDLTDYVYLGDEAARHQCSIDSGCSGVTCAVSRGTGIDGYCKLKSTVYSAANGDSRFYCLAKCSAIPGPLCTPPADGLYRLAEAYCDGDDLTDYVYLGDEAARHQCSIDSGCSGVTCAVSRGTGIDGYCKLKSTVYSAANGDSRFYCLAKCSAIPSPLCTPPSPPSPPPPSPPPPPPPPS